MQNLHKVLRVMFMYVIPALVTAFMLVFIADIMLGLGMFDTPYQVQAFTERAPYIAQAFINLAMLVTVCICGALLYTKNGIRTRRGLAKTAAVSGVCAVLMHAMVYGIVIAVPTPYTLLTPDHVTLRIFALTDAAPLAGGSALLSCAAGIVIHVLAPQVLLALAVCAIALRRYAKMGGSGSAPQRLTEANGSDAAGRRPRGGMLLGA